MEGDLYVHDTICALSTSAGMAAIAVIRVSGKDAINILSTVFKPHGKLDLSDTPGHTIRYGTIYRGNELIDDVLVSIFRSPSSFTGEDSVEISCHGSTYIQKEILISLISAGARIAKPGEFTQRAFFNGKLDLAQAEAVADLIASETKSSHRIAMSQMRGGFSSELSSMRQSLLDLVSLMELELDFSEEDVEFADRAKLNELLDHVINHISSLIESFKLGNVIKNGVPVAIVGATNTGKSTLLNSLIGEERAIVSDIHGTTRDFIEDVVNISGIAFRFVDTAGIRKAKEEIEILGIERTYDKIRSAHIVMLMLDAEREDTFAIGIKALASRIKGDQLVIVLLNKCELVCKKELDTLVKNIKNQALDEGLKLYAILPISAKLNIGLDKLKTILVNSQEDIASNSSEILVNNIRHFEALKLALEALERVRDGMEEKLPTDLLTQDIREAIFHLGEIVGEITTDEILDSIFSKFCIGK